MGAAFFVGYMSTSHTVTTQLEAASRASSHATLSADGGGGGEGGISVRTAFLLDDIDSVPDTMAGFVAAGARARPGHDNELVVPSDNSEGGLDIELWNE